MVPVALNKIHFQLEGPGKIIGVGNGDPNCHESDKEPKRSLYNGLAQVIVQSTKTAGEIVIEATVGEEHPKYPSATLTSKYLRGDLRAESIGEPRLPAVAHEKGEQPQRGASRQGGQLGWAGLHPSRCKPCA